LPRLSLPPRHPRITGEFGFVRWIAHESGIGYAVVDAVMRERRPQCALRTADALLAAVGETGALVDGRVRVLFREYRAPAVAEARPGSCAR
jgi:hypothetical protein